MAWGPKFAPSSSQASAQLGDRSRNLGKLELGIPFLLWVRIRQTHGTMAPTKSRRVDHVQALVRRLGLSDRAERWSLATRQETLQYRLHL